MKPDPIGHAVVTGGNGALAQAIARHFRKHNREVLTPSRRELDVTDANAVFRYFDGMAIELLVCAAGLVRDRPLAKMNEEEWDEVWGINFAGAAACAAAVIPQMESIGSGHIIFISSNSANVPPPGQVSYAAAKAALLGLTKELAHRHGPAGIRVNAILPGFMETPMTRAVSDSRRRVILRDHALGHFNTPDAVAHFIFHLYNHLPHTSGQIFQLDSR
jgi:3-oxoacyl-[acyl-carrier protein] reductase